MLSAGGLPQESCSWCNVYFHSQFSRDFAFPVLQRSVLLKALVKVISRALFLHVEVVVNDRML
jgi:hypothetical protein